MQFPDNYHPLNPNKPVATETSFTINFIGALLGLFFLLTANFLGYINPFGLFITTAVVVFVSITSLEYLIYKKNSPLGMLAIRRPFNLKRCYYKILGLFFVFTCIMGIYWLFPMFSKGVFNQWIMNLSIISPIFFLLSIVYVVIMDIIGLEEKDEYWHIGHYLIHRTNGLSRSALANLARSWLVKLFFLGLMCPWACDKIIWFIATDFSKLTFNNPIALFFAVEGACFAIDVLYGAIGYITCFKLSNTHIRTTEPTLGGWACAIMCYWPFWAMVFYPYLFNYGYTNRWMDIFSTGSIGWYIWGSAIILLEFLYAMATIAGGLRFSNLTYRGLWNTGLYKYTKHPAYVFKNLSWWLAVMPFAIASPALAIKSSILLLGVNLIYYTRAKTEERHLSHYPEYREYALMMNEKSIFRFMEKIFPFLRYKVPHQ